jgi:type I restriction enzyme S subunit
MSHYLKSLDFSSLNSGSAQPSLNRNYIYTVPARVPDIDTQRRIASILSAYDDLIENNTRRIAILEEMARALYKEWFVHFRFPGHKHVPLVDSRLGPIPEGWEPHILSDIAQDHRRAVQPDVLDADTPCVGLEHIPRRSIALSEWAKASDVQSTKLRFRKSEILFGKIRPYFHKVSVAPIDGVCSSDAIVISSKNTDWWPVVLMCVSSDQFVAHSVQTSNGTKMPRANWDVFLKYGTPILRDELLGRFNRFVRDVVHQIHVLIAKNGNLRTTRDLLLPKLISGEIDVSAVSDEPVAEAAD